MRILSFGKHWLKLDQHEFTTFRFPRKDKDWEDKELVQIVLQSRSKNRIVLGVAQIVSKERRVLFSPFGISDEEAVADGFWNSIDMIDWLKKTYPRERIWLNPLNKLTLRWIKGE